MKKNRYPIYIPSKGRHDVAKTPRALSEIGLDYYIVVEDEEYDLYKRNFDESNLLRLPFSNLGQGSIPARNWIWEHSLSNGDERHWVIDDNIYKFCRSNRNRNVQVRSGAIFRASEDFVDRYENIGLAGFQYLNFSAGGRKKIGPFSLNTRIYSTILINNSIDFRWRGRYNEDTDLSLRVLKSGLVTVLFNCFLQDKARTMSVKGGNTDNLYNDTDNRREFAESLRDQHPDVTTIVWRYNRWHHQVDYSAFKNNEMIMKKGLSIPEGNDEYGMVLVEKGLDEPKDK